jgi:hypothetical protein
LPKKRQSRSSWVVPLGAVVSVVVVVAAVSLLDPEEKPPTVAHPPPSSFALPYSGVDTVVLDDRYVAVTSTDFISRQRDGRLEVRRRDRLDQVVARMGTSYPHGGPICPVLAGGRIYWTDSETVPSTLDPGPAGRYSVWERDLTSGVQRRLAQWVAPAVADSDASIACPVAGAGKVAWAADQAHATVLDLTSGTTTSEPLTGGLVAITQWGLLTTSRTEPGSASSSMLLRLDGEPLRTVRDGTAVDANGNHVVWFTTDPAAETQDGAFVWTCSLPACDDARQIGKDEGAGWADIGSTFLAWARLSDAPRLMRWDGEPVPTLAPGEVFFRAKAAYGDTFAYVTVAGDDLTKDPATLHVVQIS